MSEKQQQRWYGSGRWKKVREYQLAFRPLCATCLERGVVTPATVVDHVIPHRGDATLFWFGALQSLCEHCHSATKQRLERRGYSDAIGPNGWPTDPMHPANAPPRA